MSIIEYMIIIEMVVGTLFLWWLMWDVTEATKEEIARLRRTYQRLQGFARQPLIVADASIRGRCNRLFIITVINGLATAVLLLVHAPEWWWRGWGLVTAICLLTAEALYAEAYFEHKRGMYGADLHHSKKMLG